MVFIDPRSYEQYTLPKETVSDILPLMKEGDIYQVFTLEGKAVSLRPPLKVKLKVTQASAGARGNTVTGATKQVEVETGYRLQVPLFIKEGDTISINVETGQYVERA